MNDLEQIKIQTNKNTVIGIATIGAFVVAMVYVGSTWFTVGAVLALLGSWIKGTATKYLQWDKEEKLIVGHLSLRAASRKSGTSKEEIKRSIQTGERIGEYRWTTLKFKDELDISRNVKV